MHYRAADYIASCNYGLGKLFKRVEEEDVNDVGVKSVSVNYRQLLQKIKIAGSFREWVNT